MIRFLLIFILLLLGLAAAFWFSAKELPDWYDKDRRQEIELSNRLERKIEAQGVNRFLGSKIAEVMNGQLLLDETEFNALVLHSLKRDPDGRRLLAVSDAVHVDLDDQGIELGVIINMKKVARADKRAKEAVEKALQVIPLSRDEKIAISIRGVPVARNGNIGFTDDFTISLGAIPLTSELLRSLGVEVDRVTRESLDVRNLSINSIETLDDQILLGVTPRF